ncbi:hypothetical protein P20495_0171 [Pseudoalteromonas sp. BSi20495]|nr:hypothetical protein P20495_0171 [Pseudoalteromonas sp. BSi20495]
MPNMRCPLGSIHKGQHALNNEIYALLSSCFIIAIIGH